MSSNKYEEFLNFKKKYASSEYLQYGQVALALTESSGNKKEAANMLGITYGALSRFIKDNPDIEQVIYLADSQTTDEAKAGLKAKIKEHDLNAIKYWLDRKAKDEFSTRTEVTGKDGSDLYSGASREDADAIIAAFMNASKGSEVKEGAPSKDKMN